MPATDSGGARVAWEQEIDTTRTAHVEVVGDDRLEELPATERGIEDVGQTHLELPDGQAMTAAGTRLLLGGGPGASSQRR